MKKNIENDYDIHFIFSFTSFYKHAAFSFLLKI